MNRNRKWCAAILGCLMLVPLSLPAQDAETTGLRLESGDVVRITVFGQPDLTTVTRVHEDGSVSFPLVGAVAVAGRSTAEAERLIADRLRSGGYVNNAQVNMFLEEKSQGLTDQATILGEVERPGKYPLQSVSFAGVGSVVELLAVAGGTTDSAADQVFLIRHTGDAQERKTIDLVQLLQNGDLSADVVLRKGDVILVPETDFFYIYGHVEKPGQYPLKRELTVMQALSIASGVTRIGKEDGIRLRRRTPDGINEVKVSLTDFVMPNDVIYVEERRF